MCCFIAWPAKCKSPVSYEKIMSAINTPFRTRLRAGRSFFLTPGSRPDTFVGGRAAGGDAIIADLESTVASEDKEQARENALTWLRQPASTDFVRIVRINSPLSAEGLKVT